MRFRHVKTGEVMNEEEFNRFRAPFMRKEPLLVSELKDFELIPDDRDEEKLVKTKQTNQTKGMSQEHFEALVTEIREKSLDTLLKKNANYGSVDKLHNFRRGAAILGCTPAQAALGYMTKHLASLTDKIQSNDFSDRDDFLEKIQDSINYLVFIWCCGNEERDKEAEHGA